MNRKKGIDRNGNYHSLRPSIQNQNDECSLYYILMEFNDQKLYKIGITKHKNIEKRFGSFKDLSAKYQIVATLLRSKLTTRQSAFDMEQQILSEFKNNRIILEVGQFRTTEIFNKDVLENNSYF